MNKDLDERLVPQGEYRDAMNIQVSTSDDSNVGTIQNLLGNKSIKWYYDEVRTDRLGNEVIRRIDVILNDRATCVGSISDEKNDALYWFVTEKLAKRPDVIKTPLVSRDMILQFKDNLIKPVFVNENPTIIGVYYFAPPSSLTSTAGDIFLDPRSISAISVGDILTNWEYQGNSLGNRSVTVESINLNNNSINIGPVITTPWSNISPPPRPFTVSFEIQKNDVLKFNPSRLINSINIVDEMLFFTDGVTEPKKINIPRSIEGTFPSAKQHTRIINESQGISPADNILALEEHITMIKKAPKNVLTVDAKSRDVGAFGETLIDNNFSGSASSGGLTVPVEVGQTIGVLLNLDTNFSTDYTINHVDVDDVLLFNKLTNLLQPQDSNIISARVTAINTNNVDINILGATVVAANQYLSLNIEIISISTPQVFEQPQLFNWAVEVNEDQKFKDKFPRFSYRYKYIDGEYSTFAPFTNVIFEPGQFLYQPKEAYNLGMENQITKIIIRDFGNNIPKDVVAIDLLYKESNSPIVYSVDTIDLELEQAYSYPNSLQDKSYEIKPNMISTTLPENQLLRAFDNVPRTALAQEVIGNRIVYANYLQNYNLKNPTISASLIERSLSDTNSGFKSVKSLRNYSFGISYLDTYGRQTPVFTSKEADIEIPITKSNKQNQVSIGLPFQHPDWAKYYKVFVKETSNEYYNLAMGRIYDAKDGNIWMAFPSSDRNKVDEESFLILKKGVEQNNHISESNKYKILSIRNEAPTFIKTKFTRIIDNATYYVDTSNPSLANVVYPSAPLKDKDEFKINISNWDHIPLEDLELPGSVRFSVVVGSTTKKSTDYYDIISITLDGGGTNATTYTVKLNKKIKEEWMPEATSQIDDSFAVTFFRKITENRAEYEGRFFVKISRDRLINETILSDAAVQESTEYQTTASTPFYFIADQGGTSGYNTTSSSGGATTEFSYQGSTTTGWDYLSNLYNDGNGFWFIDAAFYTGTYTSDSQGFLAKTGMWMRPNFPRDYRNNEDQGLSGTFNSFDPIVQDGFNKGIHSVSDASGTKYYIDFSYLSIGPNMHNDNFITSNTTQVDWAEDYVEELTGYEAIQDDTIGPGGSITMGNQGAFYKDTYDYADTNNIINKWRVGSTQNPEHENQKDIVQKFIRGQKFKFLGSEQSYTIVDVEIKYHVNYLDASQMQAQWQQMINNRNSSTNVVDAGIDKNDVRDMLNKLREFGLRQNKRVTYRLQVDIDPLSDTALSGGNILDSLNANIGSQTPGELVFIEPYFKSIDDTEVSLFPAVWETEPKQDVGLDIYHEIDGTFPIQINSDTNYMFAPAGSSVTFAGNSNLAGGTDILNNLLQDIKVVGWSDNVVELNTHITEVMITAFQFTHFDFLRKDGSIVRARVLGVFDPALDTVITSSGFNLGQLFGSKKIIIDRNVGNEPVKLSYFNCYSFGNGVESNRIRDDFNQVVIDKGAKASSTVEEKYEEEQRKYGLIYSGLYNSISGINNLNQFVQAEKITKDINPTYGSIQRLHSRDSDLVVLCEDKVLKIQANKDALFNADGNPQLIASTNVLGQTIPFVGEYGISKNPESFASEAYRAYFTDKVRGKVMRLSMDGLTPISDAGMKSWFRDNLKNANQLIGSYDDKKDEYNICLKSEQGDTRGLINTTVTFKENVRGWTSFKSFVYENAVSCANNYYTFKDGNIFKHHEKDQEANNFYGQYIESSFNVILNEAPGSIKSFKTLNYEGTQSKVTSDSSVDDGEYYNLEDKDGWYVEALSTEQDTGTSLEFIEKEKKWYNYIRGEELSVVDYVAQNFGGDNFSHQGLGYNTPRVTSTQSTITNIITLRFMLDEINTSLQPGDLMFYIPNSSTSTTNNITSSNQAPLFIGVVTAISPEIFTGTTGSSNAPTYEKGWFVYVEYEPANTNPQPTNGDEYLMFAKNNVVNTSGLKGYYLDAKFINNSKEKVELFSVGSEISESSK